MGQQEQASAFEEIARIEAEKKEEKTRSLNEAAVGIADMVEGNRVLQQRAEAAKKEQGQWDSPFHREMASYGQEISSLLKREVDLTTEIPERKKRLQEFKDSFADDLDSHADLLQRAEEEIQQLVQELRQFPEKEQEVQKKCDARRALDAEMRKAYEEIEKDNNGHGIRFAVETTLQQMKEAAEPLGLDQHELERAVSRELYTREEERRKEREQKQDHELEQTETAWLDELEKSLAEERTRLEKMIEDKTKFLRGETPDGEGFIADVNARYGKIEALQKKWTFREKTRDHNERQAASDGRAIDELFKSEEDTLYQIYSEIHDSWSRMMARKPEIKGGYAHSLMEYPRDGNYSYHSQELRQPIAERARDLAARITASRKEIEAKQNELHPLLKKIRTRETGR